MSANVDLNLEEDSRSLCPICIYPYGYGSQNQLGYVTDLGIDMGGGN